MPLEQAVRKLTGEPADMFGFVRRGYLREGYWADVCVFDPQTVGPGPTAARARLPGRRRTPDRRGADRRAARARQRHADPPRRARSSTRPSCAPACAPRSPDRALRPDPRRASTAPGAGPRRCRELETTRPRGDRHRHARSRPRPGAATSRPPSSTRAVASALQTGDVASGHSASRLRRHASPRTPPRSSSPTSSVTSPAALPRRTHVPGGARIARRTPTPGAGRRRLGAEPSNDARRR